MLLGFCHNCEKRSLEINKYSIEQYSKYCPECKYYVVKYYSDLFAEL